MHTRMRLDQYLSVLKEKRKHDVRSQNELYETGEGISSPPGATPTEEIRLFNEYRDQANLLKVSRAAPEKRKSLMLKKFFKMNRNQQVIVFLKKDERFFKIAGKVSAIGRDFVMLTNTKERIWIPFHAIESANIPSGVPLYSTSHQNIIYDNHLKQRLLMNFGETVAKRDVFIQQFYEETLSTNLRSWKSMWIKVQLDNRVVFGKLLNSEHPFLLLSFFKEKNQIELKNIISVHSIRYISVLPLIVKRAFRRFLK